MRVIGWDNEVLKDRFTWDYQSLGVRFWGPVQVIDLHLWTSVIVGLCELRNEGPAGLLLMSLWVLYI